MTTSKQWGWGMRMTIFMIWTFACRMCDWPLMRLNVGCWMLWAFYMKMKTKKRRRLRSTTCLRLAHSTMATKQERITTKSDWCKRQRLAWEIVKWCQLQILAWYPWTMSERIAQDTVPWALNTGYKPEPWPKYTRTLAQTEYNALHSWIQKMAFSGCQLSDWDLERRQEEPELTWLMSCNESPLFALPHDSFTADAGVEMFSFFACD